MIVSIRGLSGSGKSTSVKRIRELYPCSEVMLKFRNRALVTRHWGREGLNECVSLGPYDDVNNSKGADIIPYMAQLKLLVRHYDTLGYDVVFESLILGGNSKFPREMRDEHRNNAVMLLEVPLERVAEQRKNRAIAIGNSGIFKTKTGIMTPEILNQAFGKIQQLQGVTAKRTTQETVTDDYLELVKNQSIRTITDNTDRFNLTQQFLMIKPLKYTEPKLSDLFEVDNSQ